MSAEKRIQNWILVAIVLIIAAAVPIYKVATGNPAINQGIDLVGGVDLLLEARVPEGEEKITADMMAGAINIVRNRLDPEGIKEIILQQMGDNRIVVQIPGEDDPERVKNMIGTTAILRFINAGNDPIPAGTMLRFIDTETGQPIPVFGLEEDEVPVVEDIVLIKPEPEPPVSSVITEQVLFTSENMVGFSLVTEAIESTPVEMPDENLAAEPEGAVEIEEIPVALTETIVLELAPESAITLPALAAQRQGEYLALSIDGTVQALYRISTGLTNGIPFPELADRPGFDPALWNENLYRMKVISMGMVPPQIGTPIMVFDPMTGQPVETPVYEKPASGSTRLDISLDKVILTGDDFADADVTFGQLANPIISFEFKPKGGETFGRHTATHVGQYLAIALDDRIISCPVIRQPILHGRGVIEGDFTREEARDLVVKLDSGRLPVPLQIIENRTVGPTLGEKSITDSRQAAMLGALLILLFMGFYYRLPGLMADIALIFYVAVFFGALSVLNATLTLPGIAGFILSVGMAVDANVIIFERLKEELKTGKTFRSATDAAFKRAFTAIFDSNVTTLITALVLYNLGTGPIRGFAVTLSLGILVSMFSALVFTRLLLEAALSVKDLRKYSYFGIMETDVALLGKGGDA